MEKVKEFFDIKGKLITALVGCSYNLCLIGGLIGILLYVYGMKKAKNSGMIALCIYLIINILGECLK